jgi:hypothetical protein
MCNWGQAGWGIQSHNAHVAPGGDGRPCRLDHLFLVPF